MLAIAFVQVLAFMIDATVGRSMRIPIPQMKGRVPEIVQSADNSDSQTLAPCPSQTTRVKLDTRVGLAYGFFQILS